jgi:hypothetical protein
MWTQILIMKTQNLRFKILIILWIVVKVQEIVNFENITKNFHQDEELSVSSKLFGYVLVMDEDI